ncbi:MAG: H-type lectin domain-containing protein [Pseudomonadota bacterium]
MKRLRNHLIGVDQGDVILFSDFETDGPMWSGTGPRVVRQAVAFSDAYKTPPNVQVALTMWDMDSESNPRMDVSAEQISETGCVLVFRTWGDTRVARVRASWLAIGELRHGDEWDLY